MSDISNRAPVHQTALIAVSVAMVAVAAALVAVVVKGSQVETPLALCVALLVLAAGPARARAPPFLNVVPTTARTPSALREDRNCK